MVYSLLLLYLAYALGLSVMLGRRGYRDSRATSGSTRPSPALSTSPRRILIIGATGGTGREVLRQAIERGHHVTALVRNPAKVDEQGERLRVIGGDVLDAQAVTSAMAGQDAVLSALGHKQFFGPSRILSSGSLNLVVAMQAHSVRRIVCETSLGVGDSAGRMGLLYTLFVIPVVLPWYYWDKTRQEQAVAHSGMDWTLVRPALLVDGPARGSLRHGRGIGTFVRAEKISRADVAAFMLDQLDSDEYVGAAPGVCRSRP